MGNSKKANDSTLFRMALVVAMIILATAGIVIGVANVVKKPAEDISSEQPTVAEDDTASSAASEPTEEVSVVQTPVDFSAWKAVNDEIYGWLEIPDTNISYPVLQSAESEKSTSAGTDLCGI